MKKKEIIELYKKLKPINLTGKVGYAVGKNLFTLENEIKVISSTFKPSDKFNEYETKRVALANKHAKKDESGEPIVTDGMISLDDVKAFNKDWDKLKEEYKETLDEYKKMEDDYNELLETESKIEIHKISEKEILNISHKTTSQVVKVLLSLCDETNK